MPAAVSVIVPNYNHAKFLRRRIDTILAQTFQDFELILLDDCSTDGSQMILREYASPGTRFEFNEVNSGSTFKQWNKGVRLATGKYVWIAESDDYADERFLETLASRLNTDSNAAFCYCRSWCVSAEDCVDGFSDDYLPQLLSDKWASDFEAYGPEECRRHLLFRNTVPNASSVVFRREAYWKAGGADENLVLCGDWKVWAGMALAGNTILYVGQPLSYHRFHNLSVRSQSQNGVSLIESIIVIGWILERIKLSKPERSVVLRELARGWLPFVTNSKIPARLRRTALKYAMVLDPSAWLKLIGFAPTTLRLALSRRWRSLRDRAAP
jgi:glycosyltransferase involved in cell wall biosynthesis